MLTCIVFRIAFAVQQLTAQTPTFTSVSAASFTGRTVAPDSIVSGFGTNLTATAVNAPSGTLPTTLGGIDVRVLDSSLMAYAAPLYAVSPTQINYVIPTGVKPGLATIFVRNGETSIASGVVEIAPISPALFTADRPASGAKPGRSHSGRRLRYFATDLRLRFGTLPASSDSPKRFRPANA
ncbi:MAG: hypothetical protein WKF37_20525 [Bryobacteraceae bacterium]